MMQTLYGALLAAMLLCPGYAVAGKSATDTPSVSVTAASAEEWREIALDGASFASDWLTDLDNGDFAVAAASFVPLEREPAPAADQRMLENMRAELGDFSSRWFLEAEVFAVATDNSEYRVRVRYSTQGRLKNVVEMVELLLVNGQDPRITHYAFEPYREPPDNGLRLS